MMLYQLKSGTLWHVCRFVVLDLYLSKYSFSGRFHYTKTKSSLWLQMFWHWWLYIWLVFWQGSHWFWIQFLMTSFRTPKSSHTVWPHIKCNSIFSSSTVEFVYLSRPLLTHFDIDFDLMMTGTLWWICMNMYWIFLIAIDYFMALWHVYVLVNQGTFLSLAWSKLRLCSANHRPGYWSNLPCDWLSVAWA